MMLIFNRDTFSRAPRVRPQSTPHSLLLLALLSLRQRPLMVDSLSRFPRVSMDRAMSSLPAARIPSLTTLLLPDLLLLRLVHPLV